MNLVFTALHYISLFETPSKSDTFDGDLSFAYVRYRGYPPLSDASNLSVNGTVDAFLNKFSIG